MMSLNSKQQLFVNSYLQCFNATKAALTAGYAESGAYAHGHKLLKNAEIAAAISQRLSESAMLADEVLARLAEHARCTIEPFVEQKGDSVTLNLTTDKAKANLHLIKKISQKRTVRTKGNDSEEEETTLTIELHDAQSALNTLAKHHGLLTDSVKLIGGGEHGAIEHSVMAKVNIYIPDNGRDTPTTGATNQVSSQ